MQNSPIRLGSIDLLDFEVPQSVRFGGRQRLAVHALAGGRRIVERLGPDDEDIQFQGTFSGPAAETRARAFDSLRLSGEIVWLTWESFRRQVIVRSFTADYINPWWIHYKINCLVVHQTPIISPTSITVASMVAADLSSAMAMVSGSGISLLSLQTALSSPNSMTMGTASQARAAAEASSTMDRISSQIDEQSTELGVAVPPNLQPSDMSRAYISMVNNAGSLAAATNIRGYVGRIGANIMGSN